ncbi:protein starmaker-like [Rhipicephalus sanguineus]|uniref:protein starmaker-like n=1 Tax=Rhipicephalus sanguineus TaxID=34632 RepID=UPI001895428C|nr:protein starmaker-like [Rhipicephalus sanguineus]
MFCPIIACRIPAAPDFGALHGDIAFAELWALKRAFVDMATYGVYDLVLLHQPVKEALAHSCAAAAPGADDACADEGPENVSAAQSTAAVEISGNEADDFRGGEEETGECRTGEREVAEVGVAAHAMCADAARRDDVADPERAANGANSEVEKKKKRKKKRDHDGLRSDVEATEHVGDEKYAEVDEVSVAYADVDCHDGNEEAEEFRNVEVAAVDEERAESTGGDDSAENWAGVANAHAVDKEDEIAQHGGVSGETAANTKCGPKENVRSTVVRKKRVKERIEAGTNKGESEADKEEAASAEVAPTAAANEDESSDSKGKNDED